MTRTFLISDTHFGHDNIYTFKKEGGERVRPWAESALYGDEIMIENWNSVVRPKDRVYHLGDVLIPRRAFPKLKALNGRKVLIRGNHDIFKLHEYAEYFDDIRGVGMLDGNWLTHIPVHPGSLIFRGNIHGHLHHNTVDDPRYFNVSVERINATTIEFEEVRAYFNERI